MTQVDYQTYLASREWSLIREQVRERSKNTCERCWQAPQQAVHHMTYANVGNESLDELLAVCNPCHAWLSGKDNYDPALTRYGKVYLAGKIAKNDWRRELFPEVRKSIDFQSAAPTDVVRHGFIYAGPWFTSCDHGCSHGENSHGVNASGDGKCLEAPKQRSWVTQRCTWEIEQSDSLFAWIASPDAFGSLFEIGYAAGRNKATFVGFATEDLSREMWFVRESALMGGVFPTVAAAWEKFREEVVPFARGFFGAHFVPDSRFDLYGPRA